jgi:hypothetical protein
MEIAMFLPIGYHDLSSLRLENVCESFMDCSVVVMWADNFPLYIYMNHVYFVLLVQMEEHVCIPLS